MTERHFLDDTEISTLGQLVEHQEDLARQHHLARLGLDTFIRLCAAKRGLDPNAEYRVTPRGELLDQTPPGGETEAGPPPPPADKPFNSLFGAIPRVRPPAETPLTPPGHAEALARIQEEAKARAAASPRTARGHPSGAADALGDGHPCGASGDGDDTPHPAGG